MTHLPNQLCVLLLTLVCEFLGQSDQVCTLLTLQQLYVSSEERSLKSLLDSADYLPLKVAVPLSYQLTTAQKGGKRLTPRLSRFARV